MNRFPRDLTTRERQVLQLAAEGLSNFEIADAIGMGPRNVAGVFQGVYRKWDIPAARGTARNAAIVRYMQGGRYAAK